MTTIRPCTIPVGRRKFAAVERVRDDPAVAVVHLTWGNRDAASEAVARVMARAAMAQRRMDDGDGGGGGFDVAELVPFLQEGQATKLAAAPSGGAAVRRDAGKGDRGRGGKGSGGGGGGGNESTSTAPTAAAIPGDGDDEDGELLVLGGCGPLVSLDGITQPRVLLLGETASPLPKRAGDEYGERSMWNVLDDVLDVQRVIEQGSKNRVATQRGIAIWDVLGNVHVKAPKEDGAHNRGYTMGKPSEEEDGKPPMRTAKPPKRTLAKKEDERPNDVMGFLRRYPSVHRVCFIGVKARGTFLTPCESGGVASCRRA